MRLELAGPAGDIWVFGPDDADEVVRGLAEHLAEIDAIAGAERTVALSTYIFDNDDYAVRIGELPRVRQLSPASMTSLQLDGIDELVVTVFDHGQWRVFIYAR